MMAVIMMDRESKQDLTQTIERRSNEQVDSK